MTALVLPFSSLNRDDKKVTLVANKSASVISLDGIKKKKLDNLIFEYDLMGKIKSGFCDEAEYFYESDLEKPGLILQSPKDKSSISVLGAFEGFYGKFSINLLCTGKGYLDFGYCFDTPNLRHCKQDFPNAHFNLSFGNNSNSSRQFEDYLKLFTLTGEVHRPCALQTESIGEIRDLKNPHYSENFKGYPIKIVERMLIYSIKEYLTPFKIDF